MADQQDDFGREESMAELRRKRKSVTQILPEIEVTEQKAAAKPKKVPLMERPAHAVRDSMLHSNSGFNNYRGLYNLALLALFISGFRIAIINFLKYGVLINPYSILKVFVQHPTSFPCLLLGLLSNVHVMGALKIEQFASRKTISSPVADFLHWTNFLSALIFPCAAVLHLQPLPLSAFLLTAYSSITWMKLVSYQAVNKHYRNTFKNDKSTAKDVDEDDAKYLQRYPQNLNYTDMYYFMCAPTLCYELNFPRTKVIRKRFLFRRCLEVVFFLFLMTGLCQQWVIPTVSNTFELAPDPNQGLKDQVIYYVSRTLKLALPHNCLWLLMFYMYFHSLLNALGEVLRFGDRQFYRDWWNATTLSYFWRNWNIPVHKWCRRHVYQPLVESGYSKVTSQLVVFLLSALFHELLVGVPLGLLKFWSFLAMILQLPLVIITETYFKGSQYGNIIMWASLFLGQPAAVMLYVHAYMQHE